LGLLTPKKDGCTMTMLLARGVEVETIDELLAAGLAIKKSELVGRGRPIEITRIAITDDGRRALAQRADLVGLVVVPDHCAGHSMA
jgi:pyrimidine operon attenuation protein/uracil phosphoribosyltransferase